MQPDRRNQAVSRFAALFLDEGSPPSVYPNVRYFYGREQGPTDGSWATAYLCEKLIDSITAGQVDIYLPVGATWPGSAFSAEVNRRVSSGCYYYPIDSTALRPSLSGTNPTLYHQQLNMPDLRGLTEMSRVWRGVATKRKQTTAPRQWIPFIQNHSNIYDSLAYDDDPLREPTAAEIRHQCNLSLAHGADGVLFYSFISGPGHTDAPYWPRSLAEWQADTSGSSARILDPRMGTLSFVQDTLERRRCDWNGENKWDSVSTYIETFLRPVGDFVHSNLTWDESKEWNLQQSPNLTGTNTHVSKVLSFRQDVPNPIDEADSTLVQITEFSEAQTRYLLVLNGRTHPTEGHRHITVKLASDGGDDTQWKVTKILGEDEEGDIWIVRPHDTPDTTTTANGFTDYFEPGTAGLYRLEVIEDEAVSFNGDCLGGNIYIEPAATLRTDATDDLKFSVGHGLICSGRLYANQSTFESCDAETYWEGVVGRDSGIVMLEGVTVSGGHVVSGSDATVSLTHSCQLQSVSIAMMNYGGCLTSNASISSSIVRHLHAVGNGSTRLLSDSSTGDGSPRSTAIYVAFNSDSVSLEECVFTQYDRGVKVIDSWIVGDSDWKIPADSGNNSFRVDTIGLEAESSGDIYLGETVASPSTEALNEIDISNQQGFHAVTDGTSTISARQNWWGPSGTPNTAGTVATFNELTYDPVPFAANRSALSKQSSISATPPSFPGGIRDSLVSALRQKRIEDVRRIAGQFMRSASFVSARYGDLRSLHHALRTIEATDLSDTLLTLLLTQSGVEVKLLAADMLTADGLHEQAVSVLNSYSFAGSPVLLKRALLRKALLYPYAQRGGYHSGLRALDSLRQLLSAQDPLHDFCEMYPILYSNLRHRSVSGTAKKHITRTALDRVIPEGLEIGQNYPNPFQDLTSFTFKLGDATHVRLSVHDAMGREVAVLTNAEYYRGVHSVVLQCAHLPSGLYFYRFITDDGIIQRKMLLLR